MENIPIKRDIHLNVEQIPLTRVIPVLAHPHTLPSSEVQLSIRDRDGDVTSHQAGFHVTRLQLKKSQLIKFKFLMFSIDG